MKTRFAPSPTGKLHIGNVRTALFAYLAAKSNDGEFLLRIEDTDRERFVEGAEQQIIDSLNWLGIEVSDNPPRQSERLGLYVEYAQKLIDKGLAYADPYSQKEIEEFRDLAKVEKRPFLYRNHRPENPPKWDGSQPLRFKVPEIKRYKWTDIVRGDLTAGEDALDDMIILKAKDENGDIYPTYNFAHIVDDHDMEITHVIRGEEFISSMPKYLALYDALEIKWPKFATAPPILGKEGGKKLSKRDGAISVLDYKQQGYLPEAVNNFLASLGWNDGTDQEVYTTQQLIKKFTLKRIQKSPARFDEAKLNWLNWQHFKLMVDNKSEKIIELLEDRGVKFEQESIFETAKLAATKSRDVNDFIDQLDIFYGKIRVSVADANLEKIVTDQNEAKIIISDVADLLEGTEFNSAEIETVLRKYIEDNDYQPRTVLMLVRDIVTGKNVSPSLFEVMELLGKEKSLERLKFSIEA